MADQAQEKLHRTHQCGPDQAHHRRHHLEEVEQAEIVEYPDQ
jgi:hypothetical protein